MKSIKCSACGSTRVVARIGNKYCFFKCESKIVMEDVLRQIEKWKELGLVPKDSEMRVELD